MLQPLSCKLQTRSLWCKLGLNNMAGSTGATISPFWLTSVRKAHLCLDILSAEVPKNTSCMSLLFKEGDFSDEMGRRLTGRRRSGGLGLSASHKPIQLIPWVLCSCVLQVVCALHCRPTCISTFCWLKSRRTPAACRCCLNRLPLKTHAAA